MESKAAGREDMPRVVRVRSHTMDLTAKEILPGSHIRAIPYGLERPERIVSPMFSPDEDSVKSELLARVYRTAWPREFVELNAAAPAADCDVVGSGVLLGFP
jgi:hypothetical protein